MTSSDVASRAVSPARRLLAGFEELLGPAIVEVLGDAFLAAQLGDAVLAAQPFEHDAVILREQRLTSSSSR